MEGFLLDLDGLIRYWSSERKDYIIIALLGSIKGEINDVAHLNDMTQKYYLSQPGL